MKKYSLQDTMEQYKENIKEVEKLMEVNNGENREPGKGSRIRIQRF